MEQNKNYRIPQFVVTGLIAGIIGMFFSIVLGVGAWFLSNTQKTNVDVEVQRKVQEYLQAQSQNTKSVGEVEMLTAIERLTLSNKNLEGQLKEIKEDLRAINDSRVETAKNMFIKADAEQEFKQVRIEMRDLELRLKKLISNDRGE